MFDDSVRGGDGEVILTVKDETIFGGSGGNDDAYFDVSGGDVQ